MNDINYLQQSVTASFPTLPTATKQDHTIHSLSHNEKIQMAVLTDTNYFSNFENIMMDIEMDGKLSRFKVSRTKILI